MYTNITKNLLELKDENLNIDDYIEENEQIIINVSMNKLDHVCPSCGFATSRIHDYKVRTFKHGIVNGKLVILKYNRRRYICNNCNSRFPEKNKIVDRYSKISNFLNNLLIKDLTKKQTFTEIAKDNFISTSTAIRRFDKHYKVNQLELSEVISFDEFKKSNNNTASGKYALSIVNPIDKKIISIIPNRKKKEFEEYLKSIPKHSLEAVKVIIIDMWDPYRDLIYKYFPNAKIVIDRFHYVRNIIWAFNDVRVRVMNNYTTKQKGYRVLKRYYKLLNKNPYDLKSMFTHNNYFKKLMNETGIVEQCLSVDNELRDAYDLYAHFQYYTTNQFASYEEAINFLNDFINKLFNSKIKEYVSLAKMFINWKKEIANSLYLINESSNTTKRYTNGFIEGVNNYIKTFRRMSYNIRNFNRFVTRIITTFNNEFMIRA